jgi:hypothetical protein
MTIGIKFTFVIIEGKKMNHLGKPMALMIQEIIKMRNDLKKAHSDTKILNARLEKLENQQAKINFDIEEINLFGFVPCKTDGNAFPW